MPRTVGLLLAAGAGRRYGGPKALARPDGVPWVTRTLDVMRSAGCAPLLVVIGAGADQVAPLLPEDARTVTNPDWATGLGSSLQVGLDVARELPGDVDAALVMLVDLPNVTAEMLARMLGLGPDASTLAQADFDGTPGHPVLLGRNHWERIAASATGDRGARDYLRQHGATPVPLGSVTDGADVDVPTG